ncbi:MAG: Asp-tRNA(Asn)/Glu-tRNA(Gln) amidotransferase subunit GatB [Candidatus Nezhaarchaeota archaeon]|nr:Asp-tRNA(Asn)/Glu-tRNA(Gln) amidotransferase subunit GatB [Candidatus Nezhaarchaeota archaeon]MCX8141519.1 Asp-tRNA(Asn)/Glu-tRNA(Gln) amidotransferase subunit GatB [Candidatus Nezhaarchaeota archaeon]MDW8049786.1 Asp-tRNA(Asn)/Glu-tRNA(Gln) amidotransferase subunit GatB [Nitrososphaerota archaeon]
MSEFKVKIGLECHCQITSLKTKLFCKCPADYRGKPPNTNVCPTCLGLPGTLPYLNMKAVEEAIKVALALNCKINKRMIFYRKNYFYPDLSKNFQISQYDYPLAVDGWVTIDVDGKDKIIRIKRVHLEEDPGRLVYRGGIDSSPYTLVDYNRMGVTLIEVVTEPDMEAPMEAKIFLQELRSILEHLGVSDGSLEGSMRCDANISIEGGSRVEIKNISSFKEVEKALSYEIIRQRSLLKRGAKVRRETRHWDEVRKITVALRAKEEEMDYRYFPEPDLVPIYLTDEMIERIRKHMPELPAVRKVRLVKQYGLTEYEARVLTSDKQLADFFEKLVSLHGKPKVDCSVVINELLRLLNEKNLEVRDLKFTPLEVSELLTMVDLGAISWKSAKYVLRRMVESGEHPKKIVELEGIRRISSVEEIERYVDIILNRYRDDVEAAIRDSKAIHRLVGEVLKETKMLADPKLTFEVVSKRIENLRRERQTSTSK